MFTVRWGPDLHTERETFPPPEFWHWTYKNFNRMLLIYTFNSGILCCCWTLLTAGLYCSKMKIVISFEMINIQGLIETFHENSIVGSRSFFAVLCNDNICYDCYCVTVLNNCSLVCVHVV